MKSILCALAVTLTVSGCITPQNEAVRTLSYQQAVKAIPVGSSKARVLEVMGKPNTVNSMNGEEMWSYVDQSVNIGKVLNPFGNALRGVNTKSFIIHFNRNGRVKRVTQNTFNL